jgi:thiol-disulfide isomerase/thioredoxin
MKNKLIIRIIVFSLCFVINLSACSIIVPETQIPETILPSQVIYAPTTNPSTEVPIITDAIKLTGTAFVTSTPSPDGSLYPEPNTDQIQNPTSSQTTPEAYPPISPVSTSAPTLSSPDENLLTPSGENPLVSPSISPMITENGYTQTPIINTELVASDPATVKLASGEPQFIELFAFWCPICRSMAPIMHLLEQKFSGKVRFIFLDIDNPANDAFKRTLGFKSPPQFFLIDGQGNTLNQWNGYVSEEELEVALSTLK